MAIIISKKSYSTPMKIKTEKDNKKVDLANKFFKKRLRLTMEY
jgi:hypothetical protein